MGEKYILLHTKYSLLIRLKLFLIIGLLFSNCCLAQSLNSLTGLYNIPTAKIFRDGEIVVGIYYLPFDYVKDKGFDRNAINYFVAMGFLPFTEISVRFTKKLSPYALGDRMFNFKLKPIEESRYVPAIALGAHDLFHSTKNKTNRFNSFYLAASKNIQPGEIITNVSFNAGYGFDWFKASGYQYIGLFGGISITAFNILEIISEYDAKDLNCAVRVTLFKHIRLLGGFLAFKHFSGGGSINILL